jgi:hypothetical protein
MRDDSTRRVYRLHDFSRALQITPDQYYCVSGKVNSADKLCSLECGITWMAGCGDERPHLYLPLTIAQTFTVGIARTP